MATVDSLNPQSSIYSTVTNLMTLERQPELALKSRLGDMKALNGIYADVKANLTALRTQTTAMTDVVANPFGACAATSSDASVLSATAGAGASMGTHSLTVSCLAKNDTLVSNRLTRSDTSIRDALGVGDQTFSITVKGVSTPVTVSIDAQDTNEDIIAATAAAINAAMQGVTDPVSATALGDTPDSSKLVLRSASTGLENKMTLSDTTGTLLQTLGIANTAVAATDTTGGCIYADSDLDAAFTLDGVQIKRSSNTVSDALTGVTLTLNAAQASGEKAVTLTVGADTASVRSTVNAFITAFNTALDQLKGKTAIDPSTGARQPLSGNSLYRNLISDLRTTAGQAVTTGVASIRTLADIGITQSDAGDLSVSDETKFNDAVAHNASAVKTLFVGDGGVAAALDSLVQPFVKTGGYVDGDTTSTSQSIQYVNDSINRMEAHFTIRQQQLINEYSTLQQTLASLSGQGNFLEAPE